MFKKFEDIVEEKNLHEIDMEKTLEENHNLQLELCAQNNSKILDLLKMHELNPDNYISHVNADEKNGRYTVIKTSYFSTNAISAILKINHQKNNDDIPETVSSIELTMNTPENPISSSDVLGVHDLANEAEHMSQLIHLFNDEDFKKEYAQIVKGCHLKLQELINDKTKFLEDNKEFIRYKNGRKLGLQFYNNKLSSFESIEEYLNTLQASDVFIYQHQIEESDEVFEKHFSKKEAIQFILKYVCM